MANKYYSIDISSRNKFIESIKDALVDKYGDGVTIHYCGQRSNNTSWYDLAFECPQLSEKKILIGAYQNGSNPVELSMKYSDESYSDGFPGGVSFYDTSYQSSSTWKNLHIVLGDSFLMLVSTTSLYGLAIIGKTIGGKSICCGFTTHNTTSYTTLTWAKTKDVTSDKDIGFAQFRNTVYSAVGMPYKTKLLIFHTSSDGDMLLTLPDGTPDTIDGLYMSMYCGPAPVVTLTGVFSPRNMYSNSDVSTIRLSSSILAELETE